jgi:tRNA wybutosine-synthesizing protein 4
MTTEVQNTSLDASISKLSSISLNYFSDPFLPYFIPERFRKRRSPLINRGYYARFAIFENTIQKFMSTWPLEKHQIISLGGGWETTYFRMKSEERAPYLYVEVDLGPIVEQKATMIQSTPALLGCLTNPTFSTPKTTTTTTTTTIDKPFEIIRADGYRLIECDLTDLSTFTNRLIKTGIDPSLPTLFVSECVLVYVTPQASGELIAWAGNTFSKSAFCTYEQILPDDAFGSMMIRNLKSRGIELVGIHGHPTLLSQIERFKNRSWKRVEAFDMLNVYHKLLSPTELKRIEKLEIFDEFEEFHLMMAHYAFTLAVNGDDDTNTCLILQQQQQKV